MSGTSETQNLQRLLEAMNRKKDPISGSELRAFIERPQGPIVSEATVGLERLDVEPLAIYYDEPNRKIWRIEYVDSAGKTDNYCVCTDAVLLHLGLPKGSVPAKGKMKIIGFTDQHLPVVVVEWDGDTPGKDVFSWGAGNKFQVCHLLGEDAFVGLVDEKTIISVENTFLAASRNHHHAPGCPDFEKRTFNVRAFNASYFSIPFQAFVQHNVYGFSAMASDEKGITYGLFNLPETKMKVPIVVAETERHNARPFAGELPIEGVQFDDIFAHKGEVFIACRRDSDLLGAHYAFFRLNKATGKPGDDLRFDLTPFGLMLGPYTQKYVRGARILSMEKKSSFFAYVGAAPHGRESWCVNGQPVQPAFDHVTDLFRAPDSDSKGDIWMYYGSVGRHLFKMELPVRDKTLD